MQYRASFEPFEVFEEFNGVPGTYIKSFLISDVVNLNKWQATHEANIANLDSFLGRPGIHYINPINGKRDHTGATSFEKSLQLQELYRAASIIAVGSDIPTKKNWQISKMIDPEIAAKIISKEIRWISPSIWPEEGSVEIIKQTNDETIEVVHDYKGLHYAFVDEPAYDVDAEISAVCDGTTKACQIELAQFDAAIDNVGPLTEHKIKLNKKDKKDDSKESPNTSHISKTSKKPQMAQDEDLKKELEDAKKALKATTEELEKLKDEQAKKAQEEEDKEKTEEGKKAENEMKDDEEKQALKAQIEVLTAKAKEPIIDKIVSAQLSASVISRDSESKQRALLASKSIEELTQSYALIQPFENQLNSLTPDTTPTMGSGFGYDASLNDVDDEELLREVSQ